MPRCASDVIQNYDRLFWPAGYAGSLMLYLVALAWMYVVLMIGVAEAVSPQGTLLGALFTVVGWGLIPLAVVLYILATPARRQARRERERESAPQPDRGGHAAGDLVAPEREEP
jgi:membrane protein implicated in regulation of membrane protease activity